MKVISGSELDPITTLSKTSKR